ncbi:hypothetical protein Syun_015501 [Stephania yunnanensis]|uniref:NAB domain-containing protein n=1 Tax=Stephania yunnanensis TaxID=152371 RepID=A0AAP0JMC4_9MAGN
MDEKVKHALNLLADEGDSFAKRAEMYYKRRPELIEFVEETHGAYRALADRYDHLSGELQNANRTIATVFPEQIQYGSDEDDDDQPSHKAGRPPDQKTKEECKGRFDNPHKETAYKKATTGTGGSDISKAKALEEIDKLQKEILGLQTEKEFVKSSYETGLAKYWEIDEQIAALQNQVCSLQDEFSVRTVIPDDEARTLMATTALKSCKDTLFQLQEKQEMLAKEAKVGNKRVKKAIKKFEDLRSQFAESLNVQHAFSEKYEPIKTAAETQNTSSDSNTVESLSAKQTGKKMEDEAGNSKQGRRTVELKEGNLEAQSDTNFNASLTVIELAENIDELVTKVTGLDGQVLSQAALIERLKAQSGELQRKLQILEEEKTNLVTSNNLNGKFKELEKELLEIQSLNRNVKDHSNHLKTDFAEAHGSLDYLSENLQCVKQPPDEEVQAKPSIQTHLKEPSDEQGVRPPDEEVQAKPSIQTHPKKPSDEQGVRPPDEEVQAKPSIQAHPKEPSDEKVVQVQFVDPVSREDSPRKQGQIINISVAEGVPLPQGYHSIDMHSRSSKRMDPQNAVQEHDSSKLENNVTIIKLQERAKEEVNGQNPQTMSLDGLQDREKVLLEQYTSILQKYKGAKNELSEVHKKNHESLFETMAQVRDLLAANALKDIEIHSLRQKVIFLQNSREREDPVKSSPQNKKHNRSNAQSSDFLNTTLFKENSSDLAEDPHLESSSVANETATLPPTDASTQGEIKLPQINEPHIVLTIETKFRRDIDELLEENLAFWMRFSSSFQQIQKFQTEVDDLKVEYSKLNVSKSQEDGKAATTDQLQKSDARSICKHMREIQTELTVWLEQSMLLKDELQERFSSLENIQEELSKVSNASNDTEDANLIRYQAAKFQGEVLNMRQENNKVANELQAGVNHVMGVQSEIEKTLHKINEDLQQSGSKSTNTERSRSPQRSQIPLQSFIFGTKLKRQRHKMMFLPMPPALHKQKLFQVHR